MRKKKNRIEEGWNKNNIWSDRIGRGEILIVLDQIVSEGDYISTVKPLILLKYSFITNVLVFIPFFKVNFIHIELDRKNRYDPLISIRSDSVLPIPTLTVSVRN